MRVGLIRGTVPIVGILTIRRPFHARRSTTPTLDAVRLDAVTRAVGAIERSWAVARAWRVNAVRPE
jgi:hypothetical protein